MNKPMQKIAAKRQRQHWLFVSLIVCLFILIGILAVRYDRSVDLTTYQGNRLNPTSVQVVQRLTAPLSVTAFVSQSAKTKQLITRLLAKYQAHAEIELTFENPNVAMDLVREYDITHEGQLLLRYQGKAVTVDDLSETSITRGIYSVLQRQTRQIVFVTGHREIFPRENTPFSQLKNHFDANQLAVSAANLSLTQTVPDNTDLLVIAQAKTAYADAEIQAIIDYLNQGGQLLWLAAEESAAIPALSRFLAANIASATLLNQSGKPYQFKNSRYLAVRPHSDFVPLQSIQSIIALPNAAPITLLNTQEAEHWHSLPFFAIEEKSYLQQGQTIRQLAARPFVGVQLSANNPAQTQRAVLLGSVDFLRNEWLGQGDNTTFAVQLFRYLSTPSTDFIAIESPLPTPVILSEKTLAWLAIFCLFVMPIIILLIGKMVLRKA